jgi:protein-S-isoprenylcysteine O-methyltransferase Ste14
VLLIAVASALVFFTQPAEDPAEVRDQVHTDRNSYWWIAILSLLSLHVMLVEWAYFHDTQTQFYWSLPLGAMTLLFSLVFRIWAIRTLGDFFTSTVQIVNDHRVIDQGPYALVRHPSYTGAYLSFVGTGILLEAWIGLAFAALAMGFAYYKRISAEEATLLDHFGAAYASYAKRTKRLIPFLF